MKHFSLLPVLLIVSACGPVGYLPIEMLGPRSVRGVEAELRIGREWLEVLLHNPGSAPVRIDWAGASFTEPAGAVHPLLSSARLAQLHQYLSMRQASFYGEYNAFMLGSIAPVDFWAEEHGVSHVLERETNEISVVLKAGESIREVLYPAQHVRVGERGELLFASLFCHRGTGPGNEETFALRIPVQTEGRLQVITLVARIR
jgi:hypothetical protein